MPGLHWRDLPFLRVTRSSSALALASSIRPLASGVPPSGRGHLDDARMVAASGQQSLALRLMMPNSGAPRDATLT